MKRGWGPDLECGGDCREVGDSSIRLRPLCSEQREMTKVKRKGALDMKGIVFWDGTPPDLGPQKRHPEPASELSGPITSKMLGLHKDRLRSRNNSDSTDNDNSE